MSGLPQLQTRSRTQTCSAAARSWFEENHRRIGVQKAVSLRGTEHKPIILEERPCTQLARRLAAGAVTPRVIGIRACDEFIDASGSVTTNVTFARLTLKCDSKEPTLFRVDGRYPEGQRRVPTFVNRSGGVLEVLATPASPRSGSSRRRGIRLPLLGAPHRGLS
jgi:hypothetical protein